MSLYRFARATALLALLRRYRSRLLKMLFALVFALVTSWVYPDIAAYVGQHHAGALIWVLTLKTLVIYGAMLVVLWQLNAALRGDSEDSQQASTDAPRPVSSRRPQAEVSPLDQLIDKPRLRSRKDALLDDDA